MNIFNHINGLKTYVKDDGLIVKVQNKYLAWNIKNKVEKEGYSVQVDRNNDNYIIRIWGLQLIDAYLLKDSEGYAA